MFEQINIFLLKLRQVCSLDSSSVKRIIIITIIVLYSHQTDLRNSEEDSYKMTWFVDFLRSLYEKEINWL